MPPTDAAVRDRPTRRAPGPVLASARSQSPQALKILLLEDEPTDAELITRALREAGLDFTARRVATGAAFVAALESLAPDIVLADYELPGFGGAEALAYVRQVHPEIPVIIVTGARGDEGAVELLKAGAKDYVLKGNLLRLPSAVERAIAVEQGIRARKAAEQALRASNALLQTTERIAHIGGWHWDIAGDVLVWSAETYRIFGLDPQEWQPTVANFVAAIHPDDRQLVQDAITASTTRGAPFEVEFRIIRPDGAERITDTRAELDYDDAGKIVAMTGTSHDVTEARHADEKIREDEAKFRSLVEQNVAGIFIVREDGAIGYINPFFAKLLGYPASELIGRPLLDLLSEDDKATAQEKLGAQLFGDAEFVEHNSTIKTKDGRTIEFLVNASRSVFEGRPASLAVVLDVTESNKARRELASTAALLATEHDVSPDGIVAVDPQRSIISFNRRFVDMWGFPPEIMATRSEEQVFGWAMQNKIADPAASGPQMEAALAHPDQRAHHEATLSDGRVFEVHLAPMTRPDGGDMGRVWFFRDITERKTAERTLLRLNRTLRTLSRGNEVLVHADSEAKLLSEMCHVIVTTGGYCMAWVGVVEQDAAKSVTPVAWAGEAGDYLAEARVTWADEPRGRGLIGLAIRRGQPINCQDIAADPGMAPWQEAANKHGFASAIALPLKDQSGVFAVLSLYSAEVNAFNPDELKLLQELADDLAFGLRGLRDHAAHEALNQRWRTSLEATVGAIANTVEMRDPYTAGHQQRVARLAVAMAREVGLPEYQIQGLYLAGIVHDVGKINIPAEILNRPGKLSKLEYQLIQGHAEAGYDIVKGVDFPWPIADMVRQHHERLDGSGYPQGLKAEAILPEAKILAVADVVEAIMSHRPYRPALGVEAALAEIQKGKDRIYDPAAVEACVALFRENRFTFE